jgi:hypothetical protein
VDSWTVEQGRWLYCIFAEIETCAFATTIVLFPLQVKFIDSNKQYALGSTTTLQFWRTTSLGGRYPSYFTSSLWNFHCMGYFHIFKSNRAWYRVVRALRSIYDACAQKQQHVSRYKKKTFTLNLLSFNPIPPKCVMRKKSYFCNIDILNFLLFYCWRNWIISLKMNLRWKHAGEYHNVNIREAKFQCTVWLNRCNSSARMLYPDRTANVADIQYSTIINYPLQRFCSLYFSKSSSY